MAKPKEEQQKRVLSYENFDLIKFKIEKKGVNVTHHETGSNAGVVSKDGETTPHPDLKEKLNLLKPFMARRLGLLRGVDKGLELTKGNLDNQKIFLDLEKEIVNACNINGLTFVGSGEKRGVIMTGNVLLEHYGSIGMAVSAIRVEDDILGYEEELADICEEIKAEVYKYRFGNKKAQLDAFEGTEEEEEEE